MMISDKGSLAARAFVADGDDHVRSIPFLVHILKAFLKTEDMGLDLRPIIDAVEREPTIAARVIAHAQSAAYHSHRPALSVSDAINRIGFNRAKQVILALAMKESCDFSRCPMFQIKRFMINTIRVAHLASILGPPISALLEEVWNLPPPDSAGSNKDLAEIDTQGWYCIGLLHSIGLLYMVEREPDRMGLLLAEASAGGLLEVERSLLGFDHFDVSAVLLSGWGLPEPFHAPLFYFKSPWYREGRLWLITAVIDLARCLSSVASGQGIISDTIDEWEERWEISLPAPLPVSSATMDEATALMEAVL